LGQVEEEQLEQAVQYCNVNGEFSYKMLGTKGMKLIDPFLPVRSLPNIGLGMIAIIFGFKGTNLVVSPFESETGMLIEEAAQAIAEGLVDLCLVGGADAPFGVGVMGNLIWQVRQWQGAFPQLDFPELPLAEGAVFLVLEAEERAIARGKNIYGRVGPTVSVNQCRPGQGYEQVAQVYRDVMERLLAVEKWDAVITAERNFGYLHQVERDFWDHFNSSTMESPQKLGPYHRDIGYLASTAQLLDIGHACLMLKEPTAKLDAVLINGQSLSGGISSIIIRRI
jgi:hypothetical protein